MTQKQLSAVSSQPASSRDTGTADHHSQFIHKLFRTQELKTHNSRLLRAPFTAPARTTHYLSDIQLAVLARGNVHESVDISWAQGRLVPREHVNVMCQTQRSTQIREKLPSTKNTR
jgi:hypothetical protein